MTQRLARLAVAAAACAALAAPASAGAQNLPEECTGTMHRCAPYLIEYVCRNICA